MSHSSSPLGGSAPAVPAHLTLRSLALYREFKDMPSLARAAGVSIGSVAAANRGRMPGPRVARALCEVLRITEDELRVAVRNAHRDPIPATP